jgi:hypothetical protein
MRYYEVDCIACQIPHNKRSMAIITKIIPQRRQCFLKISAVRSDEGFHNFKPTIAFDYEEKIV